MLAGQAARDRGLPVHVERRVIEEVLGNLDFGHVRFATLGWRSGNVDLILQRAVHMPKRKRDSTGGGSPPGVFPSDPRRLPDFRQAHPDRASQLPLSRQRRPLGTPSTKMRSCQAQGDRIAGVGHSFWYLSTLVYQKGQRIPQLERQLLSRERDTCDHESGGSWRSRSWVAP